MGKSALRYGAAMRPANGDEHSGRHRTQPATWSERLIGPLITADERRRYLRAALSMALISAVIGALSLNVGWAMRGELLGQLAWYVGSFAAAMSVGMLLIAFLTRFRPTRSDEPAR